MTAVGPDGSAMELVRALRSRACWFVGFADVLDEFDERGAAVAREEAVQLRCRASVIEELSELYDELGQQAQRWHELTARTSEWLVSGVRGKMKKFSS